MTCEQDRSTDRASFMRSRLAKEFPKMDADSWKVHRAGDAIRNDIVTARWRAISALGACGPNFRRPLSPTMIG